MMNIFDLFQSKATKNRKALEDEVTKEVTTRQANKKPFYHEIVGDVVRIYSRTSGLVEEVKSENPIEKALELLSSYNGGK